MSRSDRTAAQGGPVQPSRRDRWRPLELLGLSAAFAAFAGVITLIVMRPWGDGADSTQGWLISLIAFGATFVVSLVVLAMLTLGGYEPPKEPPSRVLEADDAH